MSRRLASILLAVAVVLALPAGAQAAQTFGSRLTNSPAPGPDPCVETTPGPCTLVGFIQPNADGDPVSSPAPADGVIVRFRLRTVGAEPVTLRLATVTNQGGTLLAQAVGTGPTVTTQGTGEVEEFQARLEVKQGELLALDAPSTRMVYNQGGNEYTPLYAPPLVEGQGPRGPGGDPTGELLLQAVVEPDADGDGFGDETQDACPRQAGPGACDDAGPRVSRVSVRRRRIRYRLDEDAEVTFRLQRKRPGSARYRRMRGTFTDAGTAGRNSRKLPRRLRGRRIGPGSYRLVVLAVDEFGNETRVRKRFRIRG